MTPDDPTPVAVEPVKADVKKATRPGSQWAAGKRKKQDGYKNPQGFARGARVK